MKESTEEIWRTSGDRKEKRECLEGENCWDGLWQKGYLGGQIKGTTKSTGEGWKGTGDDGKEKGERGEEQWKR